MAEYTGQVAVHAQLAAGEPDRVTLTGTMSAVEVVNRDGTAEIYFTVNGTDPQPGAVDCYVVPAAISVTSVPVAEITAEILEQGAPIVILVSEGSPAYTVQAVS